MTVLVLVETDEGGATEVSRETLTFARGLGTELHALVVGDGPAGLVDQLGAYGVSRVHHADGDAFSSYAAAAWAAAFVAASHEAAVVMAAGTPRGNEVLAHVACRLGVAMAANVVAIDSTEQLVVSRQVLGGAATEELALGDEVAVLTVAGHACDPAPAETAVSPVVAPLEVHRPGERPAGPRGPHGAGGARRVRQPQVGPGGRGCRTGRRQRRRLQGPPRADRPARGRPRGLTRRDQPGMASAPRAGGADRQPGVARPLPGVWHQWGHPALGGDVELEDDRRHQQRPRRPDGDEGALRRHR